jgi:fatty acid CoA ligase FadD9
VKEAIMETNVFDNASLLEASINRAKSLIGSDNQIRQSAASTPALVKILGSKSSFEVVANACQLYASRPAIGFRASKITQNVKTKRNERTYFPEFQTLSYAELWARIAALATGMQGGGLVKSGEIASIICYATPDSLIADLACHYLAVASVPLANNISPKELVAILSDSKSKIMFCTIDQLENACEVLPECPFVRKVIAIDYCPEDDANAETLKRVQAKLTEMKNAPELLTMQALEEEGRRHAQIPYAKPSPNALLSLCYTSGSTGSPKGAMFFESTWHARWAAPPLWQMENIPLVSLHFLPPSHMAGRTAVMYHFKLGGAVYFTLKSDMSTLFEDIRIVRPTFVHLVPRVSEIIFQHFQSEVARRCPDLSDKKKVGEVEQEVMREMRQVYLGDRLLLTLTGSAPTPPEVLSFLQGCFEVPVLEVYGSTECGAMIVDGGLEKHNVTSYKLVSLPELGFQTTDKPFPRGELYIKAKKSIPGYLNNPEASAGILDADGLLRTGDVFEQRGPDKLVWLDRKNNVLKLSQGEYVTIWKIEGLFMAGSRCIKQIYVYGQSTRAFLLAVIVPDMDAVRSELTNEGKPVDPEAIKLCLRAELTRVAKENELRSYEVPRDFIVEPNPFSKENGLLTSVNKPARPNLKAKYGKDLERIYDDIETKQRNEMANLLRVDGTDISVAQKVRQALIAALGIDRVELNEGQSFKSLGGDSLHAAKFSAFIEKICGVKVSVSTILGPHTSIGEVIQRVESLVAGNAMNVTFESIHGSGATVVDEKDLRLDRFLSPGELAEAEKLIGSSINDVPKNVLLTGATGFLGRFLCLALLERAASNGGKVTCLVRARSAADAQARVQACFDSNPALQERFAQLAKDRLQIVAADLEKAKFGLSDQLYDELASECDTIVHCAALVNHALSYIDLFEPNVLGTVEVLRFALRKRLKRMNYVSTVGVILGLLAEREVILEAEDPRSLKSTWSLSQNGNALGYNISKWAGEVLTAEVRERFGIPANLFRCSMILPHSHFQGQINRDDFFSRLIFSIIETGLAPASFYKDVSTDVKPHIDGLPVDFVAMALTAIAYRAGGRSETYHVNNIHRPDGVSLDGIVHLARAKGYSVKLIEDYGQWYNEFSEKLKNLAPEKQQYSSLPIITQWKRPLSARERSRIDISQFRTSVKSLRPGGAEDIPPLSAEYIKKCFADLEFLGLIPKVN